MKTWVSLLSCLSIPRRRIASRYAQRHMLQEVETQHQFQAQRRPPRTLARRGIIRRTHLVQQPRPRHQDLHLRQETVPAGRLVLGVILGLGEGDLLKHGAIRGRGEDGSEYIARNPYGFNGSSSPLVLTSAIPVRRVLSTHRFNQWVGRVQFRDLSSDDGLERELRANPP